MATTINGETISLNDGNLMPLIGLGTSRASAAEVEYAVEEALKIGYRHIDTAYFYQNEVSVGRGIQNWIGKHGGTRKDIFVVSKLPMTGMAPERVEKYLKLSLSALNLSYLDLYLIHTPFGCKQGKDEKELIPIGQNGEMLIDNSTDLMAIWKVMEKMADIGLTKSIGVSNFNLRQLRKICAASRITPAVNQVELNVYLQETELQEFCKEQNVVITAFGPLGSPGRTPTQPQATILPLLSDPVVTLVAKNHNVSTAQVLIRFLVQLGISTIPKSANSKRLKMNKDVFDFKLSDVEMDALKSLDRGEKGRTFLYDISNLITEHPEYPFTAYFS